MKKKSVFRAFALIISAVVMFSSLPAAVSASNRIGDVVDYVLYTDIITYINGYPIQSYNIGGKTAVVAEDLLSYGFGVAWNGGDRSLSVSLDPSAVIAPAFKPSSVTHKTGTKAMPVLYSDISTYMNGARVTSYNINGYTVVYVDDLAAMFAVSGGYAWSAENRTLTLYTYSGDAVSAALSMSAAETAAAKSVYYISDYSVQYDDAGGYFTLLFGFKDQNEKRIAAPAKVSIIIKNDSGEVVYSAAKTISSGDFGTWTSPLYGDRLLASVRIYSAEITAGSSDSGTVYYTVTNPGYFYFNENSLPVYGNLPKIDLTAGCRLILPTLPQSISYIGYSGTVYSTSTVTAIDYEFEENYDGSVTLTMYFSGEKTYDSDGSTESSDCMIGWKIYDSDGYVVDDGTNFTPSLRVGEKFKNSKSYAFDLKPGTYRLEILNSD